MNEHAVRHPSEDDLIGYLDGELEAESRAQKIREHLDSCWTCRMRAASLQNAILEYARERDRSAIPQPPRPWKDLSADFQRIQDALPSPSLFRRVRMALALGAAATAAAAVTWLALPRMENKSRPPAPKPMLEMPAAPAARTAPTPGLPRSASVPPRVLPPEVPIFQHEATLHEEVAILAELHRLKADLGEPIELDRTNGNRLVLKATGLGPERSEQFRRALANYPGLQMDFAEPQALPKSTEPVASTSAARRPMAFERELLAYAGGAPNLDRLATSILDASDQITVYAHSLHNLDARFSGATLNTMEPADRAVLGELRADHQSNIRQAARSLQPLLAPIFAKLGVDATPATEPDLLASSLRLDQLLNAAFAGAQSDLSDRAIYTELSGQLKRLMEIVQ